MWEKVTQSKFWIIVLFIQYYNEILNVGTCSLFVLDFDMVWWIISCCVEWKSVGNCFILCCVNQIDCNMYTNMVPWEEERNTEEINCVLGAYSYANK